MDENMNSKSSIDSKINFRPEVLAFMDDALKNHSDPDAKNFIIPSADSVDGVIEYSARELIQLMKDRENPIGIRFYQSSEKIYDLLQSYNLKK